VKAIKEKPNKWYPLIIYNFLEFDKNLTVPDLIWLFSRPPLPIRTRLDFPRPQKERILFAAPHFRKFTPIVLKPDPFAV
jgi:hypothetical protein